MMTATFAGRTTSEYIIFAPYVNYFRLGASSALSSSLQSYPYRANKACSKSPCPIRELLEDLRTLYLFTKSDFKTILLPVTAFAIIVAPIKSLDRLPQTLIWTWLHLLQFCVSNQSNCPEEDAINKPWRPIPAGRITVAEAQRLHYCLKVACLVLSFERGVLQASIFLCLATIAYNECGWHRNVILRNACNAVGYASFELGATQLAGNLTTIRANGLVALFTSSLIVFTTIHAADFRDIKGDRLEGKMTIPIAFPEASRIGMLFSLTLWSTILGLFWNVEYRLAFLLLVMGIIVGFRFFFLRNSSADQTSYLLFNVWLSLAHICLGVGTFQARTVLPILRHPMMNFQ